MGWLLDPDERSLLVFPPRQQPELLQDPPEILPVPKLVSALQLTIGSLFDWLKV
jgi:Uma2 family endonuclease